MEPRIKERFNDAILQEAMRRYGIAAGKIELLDGFESFIYAFTRDEQDYVLRIGHSSRRNANLIRGEAHWLNTLADGGAGVARVRLSVDGNLTEPLDDGQGEYFMATAFEKARGGPIWSHNTDQRTPQFLERYGRLLGRIHAISKTYSVPNPAWTRPQWDDPLMLDAGDWIPGQEEVIDRAQALIAYLRALPKTDESYGLIHFDAHPGNFFVDETGKITLFDFDDCNYSWYINDIAIVVFYNVMGSSNNPAFAQTFVSNFLKGYIQETPLDPAWLKEIPHFLKLREIDLYSIIHRSFDVDNLDDDPWVARFMNKRKERIETGAPVVDFDFESLAELL